MTARLPFTKAGLKRAIAAVRAAGLHVTGVRPDGTLIVNEDEQPFIIDSPEHDSKWDYPRA